MELSPFFIKYHNQKEGCLVQDEYHSYFSCHLLFTHSHTAHICLAICVSKINAVVFQTPNIVFFPNIVNNESSFFCFCGDNPILGLAVPNLPSGWALVVLSMLQSSLLMNNINCVIGQLLGSQLLQQYLTQMFFSLFHRCTNRGSKRLNNLNFT